MENNMCKRVRPSPLYFGAGFERQSKVWWRRSNGSNLARLQGTKGRIRALRQFFRRVRTTPVQRGCY